jgi:5-methylthioadenosine/S-adenosylhomocysteine deaminase
MKQMKTRGRQEAWILNATLVTQNNQRDVYQGHLRIAGGKITEIRKTTPKKISSEAKIIDAQGLFVLPGFVQAHVHLCQTLFRNLADDLELLDWLSERIWPMEAAHTEETLHTSALLGIHELLSSGTTCLLDMGTVRHTEAILDAVQITGIRANVGKCLMDQPRTTPAYLRESTETALKEANELFLKWNGKANDRIRISYAPRFVISCTEELLSRVQILAHEQNAIIHTHASENRKEIELVKELTGYENIQYLDRLNLTSARLVLAHCIWLNSSEMKILKTTGTHVAHCPSSNLKLASGFAQIPELRKQGINVALGADGAPCNNHLDMFQEMRLAALLHKPGRGPTTLRAQEALDMATRDGAKALNWFDQIGSIEIGKKADLIALNLHQANNLLPSFSFKNKAKGSSLDSDLIASSIVYSSHPAHVHWTMVDGRMVYSNGKVKGISTTSLIQKAHQAQMQIHRLVKKQNLNGKS